MITLHIPFTLVADIPESAFPKPGPMPAIPEATDGATLELPPDDLPNAEEGLKIK